MIHKLLLPLATTVLLLGFSSRAANPQASGDGMSTIDTTVLDVRTPAEYAAGHLQGAALSDLNGGDFTDALPRLNPNTEYLVYCRSGNRAGQATAMMQQAGIRNATNLGSIEEASRATGLPIITG